MHKMQENPQLFTIDTKSKSFIYSHNLKVKLRNKVNLFYQLYQPNWHAVKLFQRKEQFIQHKNMFDEFIENFINETIGVFKYFGNLLFHKITNNIGHSSVENMRKEV